MEEKNNKNPLSELFTDATHNIDPKQLAEVLKPYLAINRSNNKILFTPEGLTLNASKKIILFLLSRKALLALGAITEEAVTPKEVKAAFQNNMPDGTIDANLKRLSDSGLVKGDDGKYLVPDFNFSKMKVMLAVKAEKEKHGR
ncbi:MAG TPA: hypothetical protein VIJ46_01455 [Rhabdochlamydiaceae bacterium]